MLAVEVLHFQREPDIGGGGRGPGGYATPGPGTAGQVNRGSGGGGGCRVPGNGPDPSIAGPLVVMVVLVSSSSHIQPKYLKNHNG